LRKRLVAVEPTETLEGPRAASRKDVVRLLSAMS